MKVCLIAAVALLSSTTYATSIPRKAFTQILAARPMQGQDCRQRIISNLDWHWTSCGLSDPCWLAASVIPAHHRWFVNGARTGSRSVTPKHRTSVMGGERVTVVLCQQWYATLPQWWREPPVSDGSHCRVLIHEGDTAGSRHGRLL